MTEENNNEKKEKNETLNSGNSKPTAAPVVNRVEPKSKPSAKRAAKKSNDPKTEGDLIWDELSQLEINAFSIPGQKVLNQAEFHTSLGSEAIIKLKAPAIFPFLEDQFGKKFKFENFEGYIKVSRV